MKTTKLLFCILFFISCSLNAQHITGKVMPVINKTYTYKINSTNPPSSSWKVTGGTITTVVSPVEVKIKWHTRGQGKVDFLVYGSVYRSLQVEVVDVISFLTMTPIFTNEKATAMLNLGTPPGMSWRSSGATFSNKISNKTDVSWSSAGTKVLEVLSFGKPVAKITVQVRATPGNFTYAGGLAAYPGNLEIGKTTLFKGDVFLSKNLITKGNLNIENHATVKGNVSIKGHTHMKTLDVNGIVHCREVLVDTKVSAVPDYVFEDDYNLKTLEETKLFIDTNKHLPEIPSAYELGESGINLSEMNLLLLKKIEELTLHAIAQNERIKQLEKRLP